MNFALQFLINIILLNFIKSIIILPLRKTPPILNLTNTYEFINYFQQNNLYTILKIGEPSQNLEVLIKEDETIFEINSFNCYLKSYYNRYTSKSFRNISKIDIIDYNFMDKFIGEETFYFYTDLNLKNLNKYEKIIFIYDEKESIINDNNYNCGSLTLELFRYNSNKNKYNFIFELKKLGFINDYSWTIKFIENDKNDLQGYLIIGDYPHIYDSQNYKEINIRTTLNNLAEKNWNLEFKNITINDTPLTHYMKGIISFNKGYIIGTEEYKSKISYLFFNKYIENNICFDDNTNPGFFIYYCKSDKFNKTDIDKFPSLNFYHFQYNYTFSFNGTDLFLESNGYYYFLIIFDRYNYRNWYFGKLFLKKYQLIFNPDSKMISFYIDNNKEEKNDKNKDNNINLKFNKNVIFLILIIIGIISFIIGIIIGNIIYKNKKKNKANEMSDEYLFENSFDNSENN